MSYTQIDVTRPTPHVARVFLNRPEVRNAFNETSIRELAQVFAEIAKQLYAAPRPMKCWNASPPKMAKPAAFRAKLIPCAKSKSPSIRELQT